MSEKYRFAITYDDWTIKDVISSYENVHMYNFKNAKNDDDNINGLYNHWIIQRLYNLKNFSDYLTDNIMAQMILNKNYGIAFYDSGDNGYGTQSDVDDCEFILFVDHKKDFKELENCKTEIIHWSHGNICQIMPQMLTDVYHSYTLYNEKKEYRNKEYVDLTDAWINIDFEDKESIKYFFSEVKNELPDIDIKELKGYFTDHNFKYIYI